MSGRSTVFTMIYDVRHEGASDRVRRDRKVWGVRFTRCAVLDEDHVVLSFYASPDSRWRRWEDVRKSLILKWAA